jgi:hypothetical protein
MSEVARVPARIRLRRGSGSVMMMIESERAFSETPSSPEPGAATIVMFSSLLSERGGRTVPRHTSSA